MNETPYTKEEVLAAGNNLPERGLYCPKCKTIIPQFKDLSEKDRSRIMQLIREGRKTMAMQELKAATGCSLIWAKIWVLHDGKPKPVEGETVSCPYCGASLRTNLARQCRFCHKDWH